MFSVYEDGENLKISLELNDYFKEMYINTDNIENDKDFKYILKILPDFFYCYDAEENILKNFTYDCNLYHNGHKIEDISIMYWMLLHEEYIPVNFIELYVNYLNNETVLIYDHISELNTKTVSTLKLFKNYLKDIENEIYQWKIICSISYIFMLISIFSKYIM